MNKDFMNPQKNGKICENHFSTMPPGKTSPFTVERKWIILKFNDMYEFSFYNVLVNQKEFVIRQ